MKIFLLSTLFPVLVGFIFSIDNKVHAFEAKSINFNSVHIFDGDDGEVQTLDAVLTKPDGTGPFPAVVLLHTCGGPNDITTKFWPKYLADLGYVTLAVDSMGPRSMSAGKCRPLLLDKKIASRDAYGALEYLGELPFVEQDHIGAIGYSLGGIIINFFIRQNFKSPKGLNFSAGISLYGHCSFGRPGSPQQVISPRFPWVVIIGSKERPIFPKSCEDVPSLPNANLHMLEGAYHAFDNPQYKSIKKDFAGNPMLYSKKATQSAMVIIKATLKQHLLKQNLEKVSPVKDKIKNEPVGPTGYTPSQVIANTDRNGDGKLDKSEFRGPSKAFPYIDANQDGFLTKQELITAWE